MLKILDDQDPNMRLACRSWLSDSKNSYDRILDPILTEFMENNQINEQTYNPNIVTENFSKLRNIILNTQSEFIEYIVTIEVSDSISKKFKEKFENQIKNSKVDYIPKHCDKLYIQAIVYITLQFITDQADSKD